MGRYFSTKGTSSSNLPAKEEPPAPPPAPPNHEEDEAILQFYLARQTQKSLAFNRKMVVN